MEENYPRTLMEFENQFSSQAGCIDYLLKLRWLLVTYQGAVGASHLTYYLDEYTFHFNRRTSLSRGKLFYRLVQQALMVDPAPSHTLKGPTSPFLQGVDNTNLDPIDDDRDHNI